MNNIEEKLRLHLLLLHFIDYNTSTKIFTILDKKNNLYTDLDLLKLISENNISFTNSKKNISFDKWIHALQIVCLNLKKYFNKIEGFQNKLKYLDIGCGNAEKTVIISNLMELDQKNVFCTDIKSWGPYHENKKNLPFQFKHIIDDKLDFEDSSFDIISCILTLHHIKNLQSFLKEINRILKKNGLLVLIEHSVYTDNDRLIINIQHMLNSTFYDKKIDFLENPDYIECYNMYEWNFIMRENRLIFKTNAGGPLDFQNEYEKKYDNIFYAFYKKK